MLYKTQLSGASVGIVMGSFAPMHRGHIDRILRAKKQNLGGTLVIVTGSSRDAGELAGMKHTKRYRYVSEHFKNDPLVIVASLDETDLSAQDRLAQVQVLWDTHVAAGAERIWYTGASGHAGSLPLSPDERLVTDGESAVYLCTATVRANPLAHWDLLAPPFRRFFTKNVLVMGAASGGKTTLLEDLGKLLRALRYGQGRVENPPICWISWSRDCVSFRIISTAPFCVWLKPYGSRIRNRLTVSMRSSSASVA